MASSQVAIDFLSKTEASTRLSIVDDFLSQLSKFDMSARMKTDRLINKKDFVFFVASSSIDWTNSEILIVTQAFDNIKTQIENISMELPDEIAFILTDGKEEGNALYTRGNAIILQRDKLEDSLELERLIAHELFHIYTRYNPEKKEALYKIIGFHPIPDFEFPIKLKDRKITNPDATSNNHVIKVAFNNEFLWVLPILYSETSRYDLSKGGEFFDYLLFKLLVISDDKGVKLYDPNNPIILDISKVDGYFEQVGENTDYIIHPEEILADNFALMVTGSSSIPSPEIVKKINCLLRLF